MSQIEKASALFDNLAQFIDPNGSYQKEKLATMIAYILISLLTLGYAFSSSETLHNDLGAYIENNQIDNTGEQWFLLQNKSDAPWDEITFRLNSTYTLAHPQPIPAGTTSRILVQDFIYNDFIPQTQRLDSWKAVSPLTRSGPFAPADLKPQKLDLITNQGSFTALFGDPGLPATSPR